MDSGLFVIDDIQAVTQHCQAHHLQHNFTQRHVLAFSFGAVGWITGFWHLWADERIGNTPQGNQEPLVVKDKEERPSGELELSKSMQCDTFFPFSTPTLLVGRQEGHPAGKNLAVGMLVVTFRLELCTSYTSSLSSAPTPSSLLR